MISDQYAQNAVHHISHAKNHFFHPKMAQIIPRISPNAHHLAIVSHTSHNGSLVNFLLRSVTVSALLTHRLPKVSSSNSFIESIIAFSLLLT
ncbi:MAG: hypothetical protein U9Q66_02910 [Patescibacteria group bacterium]|nr:hypothetical protein [Patescibacteria group bacterium]